jgi:spermidine synthase
LTTPSQTPNSAGPRLFALLAVLAAASGAAALIYEIVWFQILELSIGSSAVSLAVILATFMGGTCLGALLLPRFISPRYNTLRTYAWIELGIGIFGMLAWFLIPLAGSVYTAWGGFGFSGFLLRGLVAAICLLPPTMLMGATLPALSRTEISSSISRIGGFYAANIAGAVFGCLLSGFYLLREFDVMVASFVAASINAAVALAAFAMSRSISSPVPLLSSGREEASSEISEENAAVYVAIALSGFCALASEAIWTRTLGLLFGASVYTLSIIVAVFLIGLGIGSGLGSLLCRVIVRPARVLGYCQLLAACGIAWTAVNVAGSLPYWPIDPSIATNSWFSLQLDLDRALWALLPPTILWGASFPLALAAAAPAKDPARLWARVYTANTLGAIAGALAASLLLIGWAGSQHAQQLLIAMSTLGALVLIIPRGLKRSAAGILAVLLCGILVYAVPPIPDVLVAHGRYAPSWNGKGDIIYSREGMNASVAVSSFPGGALTFHVAGKIQASNVPRDMRLQRMLGHLTTLAALHPRSVLVIGCGAGITAGAVSIDPEVERETIVEIEPLVPEAASLHFSKENFDVVHSSKVQIRIDDGRHYLLTSNEKFDAITADPLDPWVKGAASLYTLEFFEAARKHLNPGGVITMYIQLFETNDDAVRSAVSTFFEVFPEGTVWGNTVEGKGHDMVLLGTAGPLRINLDEMEKRWNPVALSFAAVGINSPMDLLATYAGRGSDLMEWRKGAALNRDRNLRMQYLAGMGLDLDESAAIYERMLVYRRFPEDLFEGTPERLQELRSAMMR